MTQWCKVQRAMSVRKLMTSRSPSEFSRKSPVNFLVNSQFGRRLLKFEGSQLWNRLPNDSLTFLYLNYLR